MSAFLDEMAGSSRARVREARTTRSLAALESAVQAMATPPPLRLDASGFDLIAELKLRSPAAGRLGAAGEDVAARVGGYARAGAAAVSVLTEPSRFEGSLAHLAAAAQVLTPLGVPALRKDFVVDPYQLYEARAAGAGGVLLILRMLPAAQTAALLECARALGLFVLLEAFDEEDIALMHALIEAQRGSNTLLAGLNCRDLSTLEVVPARLIELSSLLPDQVPRVAESGVTSVEDARTVAAAGYSLALVGSALMRGGDAEGLARSLIAAGRAARRADL
ncbi:MAG TPA: indole-3-glycerol-phosphate synthase [Steroidobacteraceae bacterium]|nr:indole-3-glycerol-phosphate synthase [Steroidobacteraceae bacterium]